MAVETAVNLEGEMRSSVEDLPPASSVGGGGCGGGGGGVGDGKDDYVFVNGSDVNSDDHGEIESNADVPEGGGGDGGKCNGYSANEVVDVNVVVVNGGDELNVEEESNGVELAKESVIDDSEVKVVEYGEVVVNDRDFEVVEGGDGKPEKVEDDVMVNEGSIIEGGDECNGIASPSLDDDDNDNGNGNGNGGDGVEMESQMQACGEIGDRINGFEKVEDEVPKLEVIEGNVDHLVDEVRKSEVSEGNADHHIDEVIEDNVNDHIDEVRKSEVVEDEVNPDVDQVLVAESEPMDGVGKESKSIEADVMDRSQENGDHVDVETSDGETKISDGGGGEVLLPNDAIVEEQSTECQQQDLQLADNGELDPVETEADVSERGDLDPSGMTESQDLESLDSEAIGSVEYRDDASDVRPESEVCPESHDIVEQSEGADNESNRVLTASELDGPAVESNGHCVETTAELTQEVILNSDASTVDAQSDNTDKPADDHGQGSVEVIDQVERSVECSVQEASTPDHVVEDTSLVDVVDREVSSVGVISFNEVATVDETVNPAMLNWADEVDHQESKNLENAVPKNDVTVPELSHDSESCLTSEGHDLVVSSGSQVNNGSNVVESSSLANLETHNDGIRHSVHSTQIEVKPVTNKTCGSEGTLIFGAFVCQTNSNGVSTSLADVNAQIITDGVPASSLEGSGVSTTLSDADAKIVTDGVSVSPMQESESGPDSSDGATILSDADAQIVTDEVSASHMQESVVDSSDRAGSLSDADAQTVTDGVSASPLAESGANSADGETVEPVRNPFRWLIKVPRLDNVEYEQINKLQMELAKKTQDRDAFWKVHQGRMDAFREAKAKLHAARDEKEAKAKLMMAKKREIDSAQSLLKLARDGNTVERIDAQILSMENRIQHETLNLSEEKKLIREIKQLNHQRERLAADTQGQQEVHQAVGRKVETEEQLKVLRKEMDALGGNYRMSLENLKAAERKYEEESKLKQELEVEYSSLATIREETYNHLRTLKKQAYEKNKPCYDYRDARSAILNSKAGEEESFERLCVSQVENFMELWNRNDKFRKEYIRCNMRSTLRRFNTLDGRDLGVDEKKPLLEDSSDNGAASTKVNSVATALVSEREFPSIVKKVKVEGSSKKVTVMKSTIAPTKNSAETTSNNGLAEPSRRIETEEKEEVSKLAKEEEELTRKAEEKRREEEAERLKEQRRLEEKAKAQEALERKKRMAEKAQARAKFKAEKEAEEKKKEKEKRAMKKGKKNGPTTEAADVEPDQVPESSSEATREPEVSEKPATVAKKSHKPAALLYTKQVKTIKSIPAPPAPLRNRGKRKIPQWAWWLVLAIVSALIFPLGNIDIVGLIKPFVSGSFK